MHKDEAARGALCNYPHEIGTTPKNLSAILRRAADQFPEHGVVYIQSSNMKTVYEAIDIREDHLRDRCGMTWSGWRYAQRHT
jgi:hypothetical protein